MATVLTLRLDEAGTSESRVFAFDFSTRTEIVAGDTLTGTPVVLQTSAAGLPSLTLGSPSIASGSKQVQVSISLTGGIAGTAYNLTCRCSTAGGARLVIEGILQIQGP